MHRISKTFMKEHAAMFIYHQTVRVKTYKLGKLQFSNTKLCAIFYIRAIPWKWSAEYKKIIYCNKHVTGIAGKLIICSLLRKKKYMNIYIRINCVDIWIQARTWKRLEKNCDETEVVRIKE